MSDEPTLDGDGVDRRTVLRTLSALGVGGAVGGAGAGQVAGSADPEAPTAVDTADASRPVEYVDPFIGTTRADLAQGRDAMPYGNLYPGATVPHGMVQLSPDTRRTTDPADYITHDAGYHYEDAYIDGFSHTHVSGTGCEGLGNFLFQPYVGPFENGTDGTAPTEPHEYTSAFDHADESADPGYYAVTLPDESVDVELTATTRVGLHRYTFPASTESHVVLDAGKNNGTDAPSDVSVEVRDDRTVVGSQTVPNPFCGDTSAFKVHFAAKFSKPFVDHGVWEDGVVDRSESSARGTDVGAVVDYRTAVGDEVVVKTGISYTSVENALANLRAEAPDWDFDGHRQTARDRWSEKLSRVELEGRESEKVVFYTALYNSMKGPTVFDDANGEYLGMDDQVYTADGYTQYQMFSLWDTFRAQHPLLTLVEPEVQVDAVQSLIDMYETGGWLPRWQFVNRYTNTMVSDHATAVIAETYLKGLRDFDVQTGYEAMVHNATQLPPHPLAGDFTVFETSTATGPGSRETVTADVSDALGGEAVVFQFRDPTEDTGGGPQLYDLTLRADGTEVVSFAASDPVESEYFQRGWRVHTSTNGDGELRRITNKDGYYFYRIDGIPEGTTTLEVSMDVQNQREISVAADPPGQTDFSGRIGLAEYTELGYVPHDFQPAVDAAPVWSPTSTTLENAYVDWTLSEVAADLGKRADAERFARRGQSWRNVFDDEYKMFRPRLRDGSFKTPFDPRSWDGFTEGNAVTYQWSALHDTPELVEAMGRDTFEARIEDFLSEFVFPSFYEPYEHYWQGNEPSNHTPYLPNYVDRTDLTQETVQRAMNELYTTGPSGVPGNEDVGQLSAWYVFSAMGFYPVSPASGTYQIGMPAFEEIRVNLSERYYGGGTFTVTVDGPDYDPSQLRYIERATVDGQELTEPTLDHDSVVGGGELSLTVGTEPGTWDVDDPEPVGGERRPTDPDGDGTYEDVDGDGAATYDDVVTLFDGFDDESVRNREKAFDFNGNGRLDHGDLVALMSNI
jgi:putative alpha-1,2-mannosidase